jgi:hypothetical protein
MRRGRYHDERLSFAEALSQEVADHAAQESFVVIELDDVTSAGPVRVGIAPFNPLGCRPGHDLGKGKSGAPKGNPASAVFGDDLQKLV